MKTCNSTIFIATFSHIVDFICLLSSSADIDECNDNSDGCDHQCTNTIGSYTCACFDGYKLNNDNKTCTDGENNQTLYTAVLI